MLGLLYVGAAAAREVLAVGERYAPAEDRAWAAALQDCLDAASPGGFRVHDVTAAGRSPSNTRADLDPLAPAPDALVLLSLGPPEALGLFDRLGWSWSVRALVEAAAADGRRAALLGPWPAGETLVRPSGSVPASAIGITRGARAWQAAHEIAVEGGVSHPDGRLDRAARALLPPEPPRGGLRTALREAWEPYPRVDAASLGRVACAWVLGGEGTGQ